MILDGPAIPARVPKQNAEEAQEKAQRAHLLQNPAHLIRASMDETTMPVQRR